MRPLLPVRFLVGVAMVGTVSVASLALAQPAGAVQYASCTSLSGSNTSGQTITFGGCTDPTGGSGVTTAPLTTPMTINWANGGTSTVYFHTRVHAKSKCGVGTIEENLTGHIKASTGPAAQIRGMYYSTICIDSANNVSLAPGKLVLLQI
jgi:hypothetical protein